MVEIKVFDELGGFEPFQQKQFVQKYSAFTKGETRSWLSLYDTQERQVDPLKKPF
jgi:hypothetical protein